MNQDLKFLIYLAENRRISQRQISKDLGTSLGSVNAQIKSMVANGWIIVENDIQNTVQYKLTQVGMTEKELKYLEYISNSFIAITEIKDVIKNNIRSELVRGYNHFLLVGEEDVIYKLVRMCFFEIKREYPMDFKRSANFQPDCCDSNTYVFYWNPVLEINYQNAKCIIRKI